jgi:hypothetical protein
MKRLSVSGLLLAACLAFSFSSKAEVNTDKMIGAVSNAIENSHRATPPPPAIAGLTGSNYIQYNGMFYLTLTLSAPNTEDGAGYYLRVTYLDSGVQRTQNVEFDFAVGHQDRTEICTQSSTPMDFQGVVSYTVLASW